MLAAGLVTAAAIICLGSRFAVRFERTPGQPTVLRYAAMLTAVGLPMLLFGWSVAEWASADHAATGFRDCRAGHPGVTRRSLAAPADPGGGADLLWAPLAVSTANGR